jgi:hypothetical protein
MSTIDRLIRACATGKGWRALINIKVLNNLSRDLWPERMSADDARKIEKS